MRLASRLLALLLVLLAPQTVLAQSGWPKGPAKILVGFTPGTAPDLAARILADKFAEAWGSPFVVENLPGAGSNIATDRVAKAAPDGYTLLMGGNSSLVINPSLYESLPFDPVKDFAPISQIFIAANVLAVPTEVPVKTVDELVALPSRSPENSPTAMPASAPRSIWPPSCSNTWRISMSQPCPIAARRR